MGRDLQVRQLPGAGREAFEMAHDHHGPWPACTDSYNRRCDFRNVDDFLWI